MTFARYMILWAPVFLGAISALLWAISAYEGTNPKTMIELNSWAATFAALAAAAQAIQITIDPNRKRVRDPVADKAAAAGFFRRLRSRLRRPKA